MLEERIRTRKETVLAVFMSVFFISCMFGTLIATVSAPVPGDVDGNGVVNIGDVQAVCYAFGSSTQGPNIVGTPYDSSLDVNNDGKINIVDIVIIALNFGKTDP